LEKVSDNEELKAKMAAACSGDEAYELASSVQEGFTKEEFFEAMRAAFDSEPMGELTDEDLGKVAGGMGEETLGALSAAVLPNFRAM